MPRRPPAQARQYRIEHADVRARPNITRSPSALDPDQPTWLTDYYTRQQTRTYDGLLIRLPAPRHGETALEVGCGAGQWCQDLRDRGYQVTGIDPKPEHIAANQRRDPDISYVHTSLENYWAPKPFHLVSMVAVLQQHPGPIQDDMLRKLRSLVRTGGHAIVLENIHAQATRSFFNDVPQWKAKFAATGFACVAKQTYDFSPLMRAHSRLVRSIGDAAVWLGRSPSPRLGELLRPPRLWEGLMHIDDLLEPRLADLPLPTRLAVQCGFLFEAV